jgi:hypothetical protein
MSRVKGTPNKLTSDMKSVVEKAFHKLGGVDYLVRVGKEDHKTFCALLGRLVPAQVSIALEHSFDLGSAIQIATENQQRLNALNTIDVTPDNVKVVEKPDKPQKSANVDLP